MKYMTKRNEEAMELKKGMRIEVLLDNTIERDALSGTFIGWHKLCGKNHLVIKRDDGHITYIAQRIIRTIHNVHFVNGPVAQISEF